MSKGEQRRCYRYLRRTLREKKISQKELGELLGLGQSAVSERFGGRSEWRLSEMYTIMRACKKPVEEMPLLFPENGMDTVTPALVLLQSNTAPDTKDQMTVSELIRVLAMFANAGRGREVV